MIGLQSIDCESGSQIARAEMQLAGITIKYDEQPVIAGYKNHFYGVAGNWTFHRCGTFWVASCFPLGLQIRKAKELQETEFFGEKIGQWLIPEGRWGKSLEDVAVRLPLNSPEENTDNYITCYHITSLLALKVFSETAAPVVTRRTYELKELKPEVKEKVVKHWNENEEFYCDYIIDEWKEELGKTYNEPKIAYSGFYSQGDGASFTCDATHITKEFLNEMGLVVRFKAVHDYLCSEVMYYVYRTNYHYYHSNSVTVDFKDYNLTGHEKVDSYIEELLKDIMKHLELHVKEKSDEIYSELSEAFDDFNSDASIIEGIEANGYRFYENGELV